MSQACTIDVALTCSAWTRVCPAAEGLIRGAAEIALARGASALGLAWREEAELGIILTDAGEQQRLNRDYRGSDEPTNVLAFPVWQPEMSLPPAAPVLLGDVVLALETVAQEASEQNKPFVDHLRHLVVHGVLHILGYDHLMEAEAETMEALERSILAELGVPDPYRDTILSAEAPAVQP
jgi:probable rRNA maturation factor